MTEPDYITVMSTNDPYKYLVVVMKWHGRDEEYIQGRVSESLKREAADALASSWAVALHLEIR